MRKKILVLTGASGQLGKTIQQLWPSAPIANSFDLHVLDREQLDITDYNAIENSLSAMTVSVIINAAAYTAVDGAEENDASKALAFSVNERGPKNLALWAHSNNTRLLHISTDFVFDGTGSSPYKTDDETRPLGIYGASKLAGEQAVMNTLRHSSIIVRASWLYSQYNNNFVKTMLRLMSERETLNVVSDQIGAPTSTRSLTELLFNIAASKKAKGIYHWSDKGVLSWYDFAVAIQQEGLAAGLLENSIPITAISTDQYPTAAARPAYCVLDCSRAETDFACTTAPWREQLKQVIQDLAAVKSKQK